MCCSDTGDVISTENWLFDTQIFHVHKSHSEREEIVALIIAQKDHSVSGDEHFSLMFATKNFPTSSTRIVKGQRYIFRMIDNSKRNVSISLSKEPLTQLTVRLGIEEDLLENGLG